MWWKRIFEDQSDLGSGWSERLKALQNIPPLFQMVWRAAPRVVVWSLSLRVAAALVPVGILATTRLIVDRLRNISGHGTPAGLWELVVIEFCLAISALMFARLLDFCDSLMAEEYACYINVRIIEQASRMELSAYEDPHFYDRLDRARVQGADRIGMIQASGRLVQEAISTVSLLASIAFFSPWILLALFVSAVPSLFGETHFAFLGYSLSAKQTPARRELDYLRNLGASKESAKELKVFGLGPFLVRQYKAVAHELIRANYLLGLRRALIGILFVLVGTVGYYGSYAYAIHQTVVGALSLGTLVFLAGAIAGACSNLQAMFGTFSSIGGQALYISDLLEFLSVEPKILSKPNALTVPRPIRRGFEFKNVSFSYPGSSRKVLNNINFRLEPSERIALVGKNGQGKTTIVKLITRLYEVSSGQILLDGVDIREYDLEDLWRETGVIFQDFMRYEMTFSDNIAVGRIEERDNIFRIRSAAQKSQADEIIRKLPNRYLQRLGSRFQGGVDLSGGEWQKLALARAYLREAQLLILDEPTAALDARAEHEVFKRFLELTEGKMSLLISHRFSTIRMADRILVLENGAIAEQGPHEELVRTGGGYAEMFELQASNYR